MRVLGLAGWSGAGKTRLIARLLPVLTGRGLRVSTIKHAHHAFDIDQPGKDSYVHRTAGAMEVLIASDRRWALMHESRNEPESMLADLLKRLSPCDLVLVEGFRHAAFPKLEVFRAANDRPPLHGDDRRIVAVASDTPFPNARVSIVPLDDIDAIAQTVLTHAAAIGVVLDSLTDNGTNP